MQKALLVLVLVLLVFRILGDRPKFKSGDIVRITAEITNEPIQYATSQYVKLLGLGTYLPKYPEIIYGDKIMVVGEVKKDKLKNPSLIKLERNDRSLYGIRFKIISFYKSVLPEPHSSLVAGTVLGSKQMPEVFWENLKKSGTAHVVVASGTNVTLLSGFLISFLTYFFRRKVAIYLSLASIVIYITLSGFDAPIVRAGIMGAIAFIAQEKGRLINAGRLLIITALIMVFIKPAWIYDLGFILSFVATLSLMLFQKKVDSKLKFVPNVLREGLSTSLAAQIGVAPILFVSFGKFNILSPLINALILWTIPYIMVIGGISAIVSLIIPKLGQIILYLVYPLTWWFVTIVGIFS